MDEETREALEASIAHWQEVVRNPYETDVGVSECALCRKFNHTWARWDDCCAGCPVRDRTGKSSCYGTPLYAFLKERKVGAWPNEQAKLAQAELDFLISLRPTEWLP